MSVGQTDGTDLPSNTIESAGPEFRAQRKIYGITVIGASVKHINEIIDHFTTGTVPSYSLVCSHKNEPGEDFHYHCLFQYHSNKRINGKFLFGTHVMKRVDSPQGFVDYCKGLDTKHKALGVECTVRLEEGELRTNEKSRFKSIAEVERMSVTDRKELGIQYYNIIEKINNKEAYEKSRSNRYYKPVTVEWHYGSTGSGKTRWAFEHGFETVYECKNEMLSDFGDARNIVFEEFRGKMSYDHLLQLTDSYHNYYKFRVLYGWKLIDVDFVYIASSRPPWAIYRQQVHSDDSINQLMRRLNYIVYEHRPGEIRKHHWNENTLTDSVDEWEPYVFE